MLIRIAALDGTKKAFTSVKAGLASVTKSIFSMQTALAGVAGAVGFGYLIKQSLNASDQLAKTASKIGTTTDALSRLHHASNLSGVSTDTMNMALQRFVRRTAEAAKGTGEAVGALRELGINARDIQKLPLDQRMIVLSNAFGEVSNQSDKLRLAFKLFDSEGAGLINMLNGGSDALARMFDEAEDLGLVLQQVSANGVQKANDSLYKMTSLIKGLFMQMSAALAPAITSMANQFTEWGKDTAKTYGGFKEFGEYMAKGFIDSMISALTIVVGFINTVGNSMNGLLDKLDTFKYYMNMESNKGLTEDLQEVNDALDQLRSADNPLEQVSSWMERTRLNINWDKILGGNLNEMFDFENFDEAELEKLSSTINEKLSDATNARFTPINIDALIAGLLKAKDSIGSVTDAIKGDGGSEDALGDYAKGFDAIKNMAIDMSDVIAGTMIASFNGLTQAITDGVTGAKTFGEAFKSMAKNIIDSLIKMLVQFYITQPLFNAFKSYMGDTSTVNAGGTDLNPSFDGFAANGGSVSAGQAYQVGEHGAELFIPNTNGAIVSNRDLMSGGSGTVINQTINVSTGVSQTVKAEIMNMMPQIANQTKQAVLDARTRGGSYSKGLVGA